MTRRKEKQRRSPIVGPKTRTDKLAAKLAQAKRMKARPINYI